MLAAKVYLDIYSENFNGKTISKAVATMEELM